MKRLDCFVGVKSKSLERLRISVNVHLDDISSLAEPFVTTLGMVVCHDEPECPARRLVCCPQVKVTVRAHVIRYDFLPYLLNC